MSRDYFGRLAVTVYGFNPEITIKETYATKACGNRKCGYFAMETSNAYCPNCGGKNEETTGQSKEKVNLLMLARDGDEKPDCVSAELWDIMLKLSKTLEYDSDDETLTADGITADEYEVINVTVRELSEMTVRFETKTLPLIDKANELMGKKRKAKGALRLTCKNYD